MLDDEPFLRIAVGVAAKDKIVLEPPTFLFALVIIGRCSPYTETDFLASVVGCVSSRRAVVLFAVQHAVL